ncbi:DUF262 domain-containing protein [candidate division KSB1 bacterium]|nr:DUF262 domain-containing protein [candidate division KSB1 bacterium]
MKASETKFQPIIEGTKQYVVPLFQRAYSWDKKEWEMLWEDLVYLCENNEPKSHFIGSIVTMPTTSVPEGVTKFLLIDGQQRLTTVFILLALLRDIAKKNGEGELSDEINQTMLVNPFKKGSEYFKLLPTQVDRTSFQNLIQSEPDGSTQLTRCYQFFERKLKQEGVEVQAVNSVITNRLSVVSIVLDVDDNPHLVFESLNAKGRPLTQADLIRNYFFMRIHVDEQENIHAKYWEPMQTALGDNLTECIRHYLMRNGSFVKQSDVYFILKDRVGQSDALTALKDIAVFAGYYQKFLAPENEPNIEIRAALLRLNRLEVTTAYPFLLNCYHDYAQGRLVIDDFVKILQVIENFVVRRFVCNIPTNQLNKIFPPLYEQAHLKSLPNFVDGVCSALQTRGYPKDVEFRTRLIDSKLYGTREKAVKTKLVLETLESSYLHKEQVPFDDLSIEHIMPQKLTDWWEQHLGKEWQVEYELYLHTLGNLTLTAYNTELSNDTFSEKRKRLIKSHLELNRYFESMSKWDKTEIEKRSNVLVDLALTVWPYLGDEQAESASEDNVTGKKPKILTILGQQMIVQSWRDVLIKTMSTIADLEPDLFDALAKQYPSFISSDGGRFRRSSQLPNGFYVYVNLSAKSIYQFCTQAIEFVGLSVEDWHVETE